MQLQHEKQGIVTEKAVLEPSALMFSENQEQIQKSGTVSFQYRPLFWYFTSTGSCIQFHRMVKYTHTTWETAPIIHLTCHGVRGFPVCKN